MRLAVSSIARVVCALLYLLSSDSHTRVAFSDAVEWYEQESFRKGNGIMKLKRFLVASALLSFALVGSSFAQVVEVREVTSTTQVTVAKRATLAVRYKD